MKDILIWWSMITPLVFEISVMIIFVCTLFRSNKFDFNFVRKDFWFGIYWDEKWETDGIHYRAFFCFIPCCPITLTKIHRLEDMVDYEEEEGYKEMKTLQELDKIIDDKVKEMGNRCDCGENVDPIGLYPNFKCKNCDSPLSLGQVTLGKLRKNMISVVPVDCTSCRLPVIFIWSQPDAKPTFPLNYECDCGEKFAINDRETYGFRAE